MRRISFCLLTVLLLTLPSIAAGQVCGDVSGDSNINLQDLTTILSYLLAQGPPINAQADCDGVPGVTISDAARMVDYLFISFDPMDCTLSGSYSFTPSSTDTVFLPRLLNVPLDINHVSMPVRTVFGAGVGGVYITTLPDGLTPDGVFAITDVTAESFPIAAATLVWPTFDTAIMLCTPFKADTLEGTSELFSFVFDRQTAGPTDIVPVPVDRTSPLRLAFERNGDLYVPQIAYYDYQLPPDTLYVDQTSFNITMTVGDPPGAQQFVQITSSPRSVAFAASTTQDWITILDPGEHTTPYTLAFEIDPDGLSAGDYTGTIELVPTDLSVAVPEYQVTASLTLEPLILYPWGDLNCDGRANLTDVTLLVGVLFLGWPVPSLCEQ